MNFNLTPEQIEKLKTLCIHTLIMFVISAVTILTGYTLVIQPAELMREGVLADFADQARFLAAGVGGNGLDCGAGSGNCVTARYGRSIVAYSDRETTPKWKLTASTGTVQHAGFDIVDAAASITVTNGITNLQPLGSYQPITAAGAVTVTSMLTSTSTFKPGTLVRFLNTGAQNIILPQPRQQSHARPVRPPFALVRRHALARNRLHRQLDVVVILRRERRCHPVGAIPCGRPDPANH
jgi:hypothetical protein